MVDLSDYAKETLNDVSDQIVSAIVRDRSSVQQHAVARCSPGYAILGVAGIVVVAGGGAETFLIRVALVDSMAFGAVTATDVVNRTDIQLEWPFSYEEGQGRSA